MKEVKVICPKCGHCTIFENYWTWIWYTPFHWFRKRRMKCSYCGEKSYVARERSK